MFDAGFLQSLPNAIPPIRATINIEETRCNDGKGYYRFEKLEYSVSEVENEVRMVVERVGGSRQDAQTATLIFEDKQSGSATTPLADMMQTSETFPTSCAGQSGGIRLIRTIEDEVREVFCGISADGAVGRNLTLRFACLELG